MPLIIGFTLVQVLLASAASFPLYFRSISVSSTFSQGNVGLQSSFTATGLDEVPHTFVKLSLLSFTFEGAYK